MKKTTRIIICGIAFMAGILLAEFWQQPVNWLVMLLFIPTISMVWFNKKILFIVLILFSLVGGYVRFIYSVPNITPNRISYYNNVAKSEWKDMYSTVWRGRISKEVDKRIDHVKLTLQSEALLIENKWNNVEGLVLVKTGLYPEYQYGDRLEIECKLVTPGKINDFAYDDYLSRYNIYSLCYGARIVLLERADNFSIRNYILNFKDKVHYKIQSNILEPESSVLSAMLLARRRGISPEIVNDFSRAGVSHLLAISGMHIAIISLLIARLLSIFYLPKKISYFGTLFILFIYIVMIGWPASAVRAGIMGSIVLMAEYFGRINKSYFALLLVGIVTLLINPKLIVYDIGWQLSFLAVLSLILFSDNMERIFSKLPKMFGIKTILQTTLAAQVLTLPWLAYKFGQVSLIFPVANILLLPALPLIMGVSIVTIFISFILPTLALPLFWVVWNLLNKQVEIIHWLSSMPLAAIQLPELGWIFIASIYAVVFVLRTKRHYYPHKIR